MTEPWVPKTQRGAFFDAATNALIQIRGVHFYTADQPLRLDAKAIKVSSK